jgi:hypothetical protein
MVQFVLRKPARSPQAFQGRVLAIHRRAVMPGLKEEQ